MLSNMKVKCPFNSYEEYSEIFQQSICFLLDSLQNIYRDLREEENVNVYYRQTLKVEYRDEQENKNNRENEIDNDYLLSKFGWAHVGNCGIEKKIKFLTTVEGTRVCIQESPDRSHQFYRLNESNSFSENSLYFGALFNYKAASCQKISTKKAK